MVENRADQEARTKRVFAPEKTAGNTPTKTRAPPPGYLPPTLAIASTNHHDCKSVSYTRRTHSAMVAMTTPIVSDRLHQMRDPSDVPQLKAEGGGE